MHEPGTWPDGKPIHGASVFVKLGCGHYRISKGWRGSAGEPIYCDGGCQRMTFIVATIVTNDEPHDWRMPP